ncbi:hypothetical protein A2803_03740 [Candidatus Woesebacteria bacterium RIFCSPHIGHO2_01_FULL_44_21]|uniref:DUF6883 domain-containing protein n=1 Tax=Candidatus Woesebacteria bacterium RIFCSPHIGHO2_01_FULL_44_21 TaxID=1802503 RepID=A0A1F7YX37_9BACT|nr:MAG: hypothetical protein A2803_03740 [Candidatus Woesebacteria bacterium RIFCSPHIGHO2_01_FULL_44_21]
MKLPYRKNCYVPKEKLTKYLLNLNNPRGKDKAVFFTGMGFNRVNYKFLEKELINLAQTNEANRKGGYANRSKYIIRGLITAPVGRSVSITTIWEVDKRVKKPRFITAYPLKRKKFTKSV